VRVIKKIRLPSSLKVIETDTDRSTAYDFLLKFHGNNGPISYRFRDKRRFLSKIANYSHPGICDAPDEGFPLVLGIGAEGQKTRMMGIPGRKRSLTTSSAI